jgi:hypothetical protein
MNKLRFIIISAIFLFGCSEKEELLITDSEESYISRVQVIGIDNYTIVGNATIGNGIDTVGLTVVVTVDYGVDLRKLKPMCSLSPESIMRPEEGAPPMGSWIDFTQGPYKYTVISGNRKIRNTYTISVVSQ